MNFLLTPGGVHLAWVSLPALWAWYYVPHSMKAKFLRENRLLNNKMPRENIQWIEENKKLPEAGIRFLKRCLAAHQNSLEAFVGYSVAFFACVSRGVPIEYLDKAALVFLGSRMAHTLIYVYMGDRAAWSWARSAVWFVGTGTIFSMFGKTLF